MRHARLMMLACLAATVAGAEGPTESAAPHVTIDAPLLAKSAAERAHAAAAIAESSHVRLEAHMRLGDAIEALCKSGNPTTAVKNLDISRSADIAQDGDTYWSAVAALCKAFTLKPAAGAQCSARVARDDLVAIEAGPLLLADASAEHAMILPCGALALMVKDCHLARTHGDRTDIHVGLTGILRLEPRVSPEAVGWCGLRLAQVSDQRGHLLPLGSERDREYSEVARPFDLQLSLLEEPTELTLVGDLHLAFAVPWHLTTSVSAGSTTSIACGDQMLSLLLIDSEHTAPAGTQGPLIELDYPHAAILGEPRLSVARAGVDVNARGGGSFDTATGRSIILALQKIDGDPYQATIVGSTPLGEPISMHLSMHVPLGELAGNASLDGPTAFFAPTQVRWPAAHLSLRDALGALTRAGEPVLLQLGTDERQERDLPAFSGTFWEGLLTLCHAYALEPALQSVGSGVPSPGAADDAVSEGMVTLGLGPVSVGTASGPLTATASGPLLIESTDLTMVDTRSLSGGGRHLNVSLRMRLEPRVPDETIGDCSATIDTFSRDDAGNVLTASDPRPAPSNIRQNRLRWRQNMELTPPVGDPVSFPVRIDGLLPTTRSVTIGGHLRIAVQRRAHREVALTAGAPSIIEVGNEQVSAILIDQATAETSDLNGPGVLIMGTRNLLPASLHLVAPSGATLACAGATVVPHNRNQLLYRFPVAEAGPHTLVIDDVLPAGLVRLPFSHVIAVPAGH